MIFKKKCKIRCDPEGFPLETLANAHSEHCQEAL